MDADDRFPVCGYPRDVSGRFFRESSAPQSKPDFSLGMEGALTVESDLTQAAEEKGKPSDFPGCRWLADCAP